MTVDRRQGGLFSFVHGSEWLQFTTVEMGCVKPMDEMSLRLAVVSVVAQCAFVASCYRHYSCA